MNAEWVQIIQDAGAIGALLLLIVGLLRKWFVLGWYYQEKADSEREWRELAMSNLQLTDRTVRTAEKAMGAR